MNALHRIGVVSSVLLMFIFTPTAQGGVEIFLKLDGIKGDSKAQGHLDEIDVKSVRAGVDQTGASGAAGAQNPMAAGKVSFSRMSVVKPIDRSTPALFTACVAGSHIPSATISVRNPGAEEFLHYRLSDLMVASITHTIETEANEEVSLSFARIELEYRGTDDQGKAGVPVRSGFDVGSNKAVMSGSAPADAQLGSTSPASGNPSGAAAAPPGASPQLDRAGAGAPLGAAPAAIATEPFTQARNAALKGRLGRLVVEYPKDTPCKETRVDVYKPGSKDSIQGGYGNQGFELLPGNYDVVVSSKRVANVTVSSGTDSRLRVGVLKIHGSKDTRFDLFDADNKTQLVGGYGEHELGLPVGTYNVHVAGQSEPVTITGGKTTEF